MPRNNIKQYRNEEGVAQPPHRMDTSLEAAWKREHARAEAAIAMMHDYRRRVDYWKDEAMNANIKIKAYEKMVIK